MWTIAGHGWLARRASSAKSTSDTSAGSRHAPDSMSSFQCSDTTIAGRSGYRRISPSSEISTASGRAICPARSGAAHRNARSIRANRSPALNDLSTVSVSIAGLVGGTNRAPKSAPRSCCRRRAASAAITPPASTTAAPKPLPVAMLSSARCSTTTGGLGSITDAGGTAAGSVGGGSCVVGTDSALVDGSSSGSDETAAGPGTATGVTGWRSIGAVVVTGGRAMGVPSCNTSPGRIRRASAWPSNGPLIRISCFVYAAISVPFADWPSWRSAIPQNESPDSTT